MEGNTMNARTPCAAALVALLAALASGCSNSPTSPGANANNDQSQVNATLTASATLVDDGIEESNAQVSASTTAEPTKGISTEAAVRPFTWWQDVRSTTRQWSFTFSDSDSTHRPQTCIATLAKHMTGNFVVVPVDPADSTHASTQRILKPLDKTLTRRIELKHLLINGVRTWRITGVTGGFMSTAVATTNLVSLHLHSTSGVDTTITDPTQFFPLRSVIAFGPLDTVTVTATTERTNDAVFIHRWDWRHRLHNNLDDTYSFTWVTSAWGGWRHFAIQAMSHGSLYDDTLPYDSEAWHFPFRVNGYQPPVDYYP
jgi:hypothetical protein